ncbi:MAG: nuclear transport factor 2 family protein [Steroidobacteraceae bacterium]
MNLREITDRSHIRDVITRSCSVPDNREWTAYETDVFTADAEIANPEGVFAPRAFAARAQQKLMGYPVSQHCAMHVQITVSGDEAMAMTYVLCIVVGPGSPGAAQSYQAGAIYRDTLARSPAGWRIRRRNVQPLWSNSSSAIARPTPA